MCCVTHVRFSVENGYLEDVCNALVEIFESAWVSNSDFMYVGLPLGLGILRGLFSMI